MDTLACTLAAAHKGHMWSVIIADLARHGIQVRAPAQGAAKQSQKASAVFGVSLADQVAENVPGIGRVPVFLVRAGQALEEYLQVEGIFRKNGAVGRQRKLRELLDAGSPLPADVVVHDLTSLVKQFFRDLPEPLITNDLAPAFIQASCQENEYERIRLILLLCLVMPPDHLETLTFIVLLLQHIACEAENNKMDAHNLAVCLAPNFFRNPADQAPCAKRAVIEVSIVETLINKAQDIGSLPEVLLEQVMMIDTLPDDLEGERMPSNVPAGTTDDLCSSTDAVSTADESSASQRSKKKRSGSLGRLKKVLRRSWESLIGKDKGRGDSPAAQPTVLLHSAKRKADAGSSAAAGDEPTAQPPAPKKRKALLDLHSVCQSYSPTAVEAQEKCTLRKKAMSPFDLFKKR